MPRVLVVEDDQDLRTALTELVESRGLQAIGVRDGSEALIVAQHAPPALILLDLMLLEMDGWEFRAAQLRDPRLASVPVIVLTGSGDVHYAERALGVVAVLRKPFGVESLEELLDQCLLH